jgi:predicted component of type VI protein secretion system
MSPIAVKVVVRDSSLAEKEFVFLDRGRCLIGRAENCDIHIPADRVHQDVSRYHSELEIDPPNVWVRDLGSLNGTYVNGQLIGKRPGDQQKVDSHFDPSAARELHEGDELKVGETVFHMSVGVATPSFVPSAGIPRRSRSGTDQPFGARRGRFLIVGRPLLYASKLVPKDVP